ncbi:MAG TPA: sugar ABC transporter permease [Anaerolineales bacterium]|nr:sugar ABC transporter permease [Anaerolineales bacterium]
MSRKKTLPFKPFLFIAPALFFYLAFFIWPYLQLIWLSLHEWNGFGDRIFVGFKNYADLASDNQFRLAFQHNMSWSLAAIFIPVSLGLFLALLLARTPMHGKVFFRAVYFMPQVISSISVAVVWGWIYHPTFGLLNQSLELIGLGSLARGWLGDGNFALPALFLAWSWIHYGFTMVIFIAALEGIDEVYFEVAKIDGAGWWAQLRYVVLPFIARPLTTIILVTAISSFQVFDLVFALTNGGPGRATIVLPLYMLTSAFTFHKIGYGAAIAVVLSLVVLAFSLILLRVRGSMKESVHA